MKPRRLLDPVDPIVRKVEAWRRSDGEVGTQDVVGQFDVGGSVDGWLDEFHEERISEVFCVDAVNPDGLTGRSVDGGENEVRDVVRYSFECDVREVWQ